MFPFVNNKIKFVKEKEAVAKEEQEAKQEEQQTDIHMKDSFRLLLNSITGFQIIQPKPMQIEQTRV